MNPWKLAREILVNDPDTRGEVIVRFPDTATLKASAISQVASVAISDGIRSTTTANELNRPTPAPASKVSTITTGIGQPVLISSQAQSTLVRLMTPPTEASKVPDAIGIRIASAAIADALKLLAIALTVSIVGKISGFHNENTMMISSQT